MNPFATGQVFSRANWSGHHPQEKLGRVPWRGMNASRISTSDDNTRFANIVLAHLDDAYTLAVWLTDNPVDAEELVQDACLHAFRAIKSFAGGNGRAWILTIVRHRAHMWLRKNRPAALVIEGDTEAIEPAPSAVGAVRIESPESALIATTDLARLKAAIAALPGPFLETVVLREIQGLNYHEIAEVTEVPIGTVMSRLAHGRRHLIAAIGRTDYDASGVSVARTDACHAAIASFVGIQCRDAIPPCAASLGQDSQMTDNPAAADGPARKSMPTLRTHDCVGIEPQSIEFARGPSPTLKYQASDSDH
jgi:RNA polymerase sigma factor (sigma-70 family)